MNRVQHLRLPGTKEKRIVGRPIGCSNSVTQTPEMYFLTGKSGEGTMKNFKTVPLDPFISLVLFLAATALLSHGVESTAYAVGDEDNQAQS
jgi:hypothetical protein